MRPTPPPAAPVADHRNAFYRIRMACFRASSSQLFTTAVTTALIANTVVMAMETEGGSKFLSSRFCQHVLSSLAPICRGCVRLRLSSGESDAAAEGWLEAFNVAFVALFVLEAAVKITGASPQTKFKLCRKRGTRSQGLVAVGLGWRYYWWRNWNKFDLVVSILSVAFWPLQRAGKIARRTYKALSILRTVRLAGRLRVLSRPFVLLQASLPALASVAFVIVVVVTTYAYAGFQLFEDLGDVHADNSGAYSGNKCVCGRMRAKDAPSPLNVLMHGCVQMTQASARWVTPM